MKANEFIPVPEAMDGNQDFENKMAKIGRVIMDMGTVSYTHLTLPTNREV